MSGVPSQIDEAAEMAEELFKKMYPEAAEESETQEDEDTEDVDESDTSDEDEEAEDEEEIPEDPKELKKWRDRYLTLKGKYDAEVPRLASQVKELMEKATTPPTAKIEPEVEQEDNFDDIYGEDFAQRIRKVIDDAVQSKLAPVTEKVESVEDVQRQAATDSFMSYLDEAAEGWRDLWEGKDKGFQKFLQQKDPMGLNTYQQYLETFNNDWDADGMAKIFNIYREQTTKKPDTTKERDAMIAPSRVKSSDTPSTDNKRIWTADTIKDFETADRKGQYSPEESIKLWEDILKATQEGRIR